MTETLKVTLKQHDGLAVIYTEGYINNQGGEEIAATRSQLPPRGAAAQPIGSGVAHMGDRDPIVVKHTGDDGRAHAFAMCLALSSLEDDLIGAIYGVTQDDRLTHQAAVRIDVAAIFANGSFRSLFSDDAHGDTAGDFSGVVATHTVGKH